MKYTSFVTLLILCSTNANDTDIGFFWQLTDLHLDLDYARNGCKGVYGDRSCDSSVQLAVSAINATTMMMQHPIDFVLWSGDNGPHSQQLTADRLLEGIRFLSKTMKSVFPVDKVYVLPVLGNHDVFPANQMRANSPDQSRESWCYQLASEQQLWGSWITTTNANNSVSDRSPPASNFSKGCFFSHLLRTSPSTELLLISLNGLLWYTGNPLSNNAGPDPLGQIAWLKAQFEWARQAGVKVLLVSHFPPGASENSPERFRFLHPHINAQFVRVLRDNADQLMAGLFAHTHVDSFRVLYDQTNNARPVGSLFTAPSCTPLRLTGLGSPNPRIRLYRYRRSTGVLLDYVQLYVSLPNSTSSNSTTTHPHTPPQWQIEYNSSHEYGLTDLSAHSMSTLLDRLTQDNSSGGRALWSTYWSHELGHGPRDNPPADQWCLDLLCRCRHTCPMRHVDLRRLDQCLRGCTTGSLRVLDSTAALRNQIINASQLNATISRLTTVGADSDRSSVPIVIGVIIAFLAVLVGVVLVVNREICRRRGSASRYNRGLPFPLSLVGNGGGGGGGVGEAESTVDLHPPQPDTGSITRLNENGAVRANNPPMLFCRAGDCTSDRIPVLQCAYMPLTPNNSNYSNSSSNTGGPRYSIHSTWIDTPHSAELLLIGEQDASGSAFCNTKTVNFDGSAEDYYADDEEAYEDEEEEEQLCAYEQRRVESRPLAANSSSSSEHDESAFVFPLTSTRPLMWNGLLMKHTPLIEPKQSISMDLSAVRGPVRENGSICVD